HQLACGFHDFLSPSGWATEIELLLDICEGNLFPPHRVTRKAEANSFSPSQFFFAWGCQAFNQPKQWPVTTAMGHCFGWLRLGLCVKARRNRSHQSPDRFAPRRRS